MLSCYRCCHFRELGEGYMVSLYFLEFLVNLSLSQNKSFNGDMRIGRGREEYGDGEWEKELESI